MAFATYVLLPVVVAHSVLTGHALRKVIGLGMMLKHYVSGQRRALRLTARPWLPACLPGLPFLTSYPACVHALFLLPDPPDPLSVLGPPSSACLMAIAACIRLPQSHLLLLPSRLGV